MNKLRVLFPMRSLFPRGAEKCSLYLLQALKKLPVAARVPVMRHPHIPAKDAYYLIKDFARAAEVSMSLSRDDEADSWSEFLQEEVELFHPHVVVFFGDSVVPDALSAQNLIMVAHGLNENDFSCYRDNVSSVICVSQAAVPYTVKYGVPEDKIAVIRNGVPLPSMGETPFKISFHPDCPVNGTIENVSRETLDIPQDAWIWLFVGSQTVEKGPQDVIAAMARRNRKDEYLILVGYPNPQHDMIALSKEYGVWDRCIHTGVVSTVKPLYEVADCLIVPSHQESLPLVVLEAMALGLPILAREVGGIPEILDGKIYGVMFNGFPDLGMDTARAVFSAYEGLSKRMVWDWFDNWSAERMASEYWDLFQKVAG